MSFASHGGKPQYRDMCGSKLNSTPSFQEVSMSTTLNLPAPLLRATPRAASALGSAFASMLRLVSPQVHSERYNVQFSVKQARAVADLWAQFDPRSAAELRAAADRHEQTQLLA
jgi:hypothetical protein